MFKLWLRIKGIIIRTQKAPERKRIEKSIVRITISGNPASKHTSPTFKIMFILRMKLNTTVIKVPPIKGQFLRILLFLEEKFDICKIFQQEISFKHKINGLFSLFQFIYTYSLLQHVSNLGGLFLTK